MLKSYLLTACKVMMRRKLFTAINLLCIVLTLVILLVATALLDFSFRPSGVEGRSDRFLQVTSMEVRDKFGRSSGPPGYKIVDKYLRPMKSAQLVAAVSGQLPVAVYQADRMSALQMRRADAAYWDILDFKVLAGRVPSADDVAQGRFVAVLNASTARKLFPGTIATAIGQKLVAGGQQFTVIGVVEDAMHINASADIWVPVSTTPSTTYRDKMWDNFTVLLMAASPEGIPAIKREVEAIASQIQFDDAKAPSTTTLWADSKLDLFARHLLSRRTTADSGATSVLGMIVLLMLLFMLLPALNLINLNIGRIMERSVEIGVRKAFGASSAHLIGQLVFENVVLCLAGGAISLALAPGVLQLLQYAGLIPYLNVGLNLAVFGYGLLIALVFGLLSGVVPAWKMSRLDPVFALKGAA